MEFQGKNEKEKRQKQRNLSDYQHGRHPPQSKAPWEHLLSLHTHTYTWLQHLNKIKLVDTSVPSDGSLTYIYLVSLYYYAN